MSAPSPRPLATSVHKGHYFDLLLGISALVLVLSNIAAGKGVAFGPILTDGGFFLFPLAYIVGDILAEIYGFARARRAIIFSFCCAIFASFTFWLVIKLPAADFYQNQQALEAVLGPVPLIVSGSLLGYLVGQLLNSWVMVAMKEKFQGRFLVGRLMGSTLVGELADTLIFCSIAAPIIGISNPADFLNYVVVGYLYKCLVEFLLMPLTLPVIGWFRRNEKDYRPQGAAGG
ncbi:MAG: queuosine precursor transporter [Rothia sp. (in: high G+C Gram-positive bacteria)]|nr:queuosine precursor transporter [Rothia sp. (in: high G+C Gram-positive bacteria)]